jgi:hypothetical protein
MKKNGALFFAALSRLCAVCLCASPSARLDASRHSYRTGSFIFVAKPRLLLLTTALGPIIINLFPPVQNHTSQTRKPAMSKTTPSSNDPTVTISPSNSNREDDSVCHVLPCNIEYTGMAPTHVYFRPVDHHDGNCYASMFRGRGLLAVNNDSDAGRPRPKVTGKLLSIENDELQVKSNFDKILEWQHQHHPGCLTYDADNATSRVRLAQEWFEVALAVSVHL